MSISSVIARFTRRVHAASINLHVKSLRFTVAVAKAKYRVAATEASIAVSIANEAYKQETLAVTRADEAEDHADAVYGAAEAEAKLIGGAL
jgi:ferric-dicitrate binding protein FerR (iron transport regulator)